MRNALYPESARPLRRARAQRLIGSILASFACAGAVFAQADKGILSDRQDRLDRVQAQQQTDQKADAEPWSAAKIVINLDARCPVVTTLGYFGAFATTDKDPAKQALAQARYTKLQTALQPLADELKKMAADNTFAGRSFPAALTPRLNLLCAELYGQVGKMYGDDSLAELKKYVATLAQGVVVK